MEVTATTSLLRIVTYLVVSLALLIHLPSSVQTKSVSRDQSPSNKHHDNSDAAGAGAGAGAASATAVGHRIHQHQNEQNEQVKYEVGDPQYAVKVNGVDAESPGGEDVKGLDKLPSRWGHIITAAQNLGKAALAPSHSIQEIPPGPKNEDDDDDDDGDGDDDDDSDEEDMDVVYLDVNNDDNSEEDDDDFDQDEDKDRGDDEVDDDPDRISLPAYKVKQGQGYHEKLKPHNELLDPHVEDLPTAISDSDDYGADEILKIEGTPTPALITNEEDGDITSSEFLIDNDRLMGDDSAAAEQLLKDEGVEPEKEFKPVRMPTHFESYDVDPTDGKITLEELVNITGAKVNVHKAFNASDKNGDGFLDRNEFYAAPWQLTPNWRHIPEQEVELSKAYYPSEEENEEEYEEEDEFDDEDEDDDDDDDWDDWDDWEDNNDFWNDVEDADLF